MNVLLVEPWSMEPAPVDALEEVFAALPNGGRFLRTEDGASVLHEGMLVLVARDLQFAELAATRQGYARSTRFAVIDRPEAAVPYERPEFVPVEGPHSGKLYGEHADAVHASRKERLRSEQEAAEKAAEDERIAQAQAEAAQGAVDDQERAAAEALAAHKKTNPARVPTEVPVIRPGSDGPQAKS